MVADDFDGGFVRAHRTVGTEAPELAGGGSCGCGVDIRTCRQRSKGHIVYDTDSKAVFGHRQFQVFKYRQDMGRNHIFGSQSIAAANDDRLPLCAVECTLDVEIQGLTDRSRLFGPVQHGNLFNSLGNITEEMFERKGAVEMNCQQADFLTTRIEIIDCFFDDVAYRSHGDDDAVSVLRAIVVEQMIIPTSQFVDLAHVFFDNSGNSFIIGVGNFPFLEVNVRILRGASNNRVIRAQRPAAECIQGVLINQLRQFIIFHYFDFLGFV